jgi:hypothetical protein
MFRRARQSSALPPSEATCTTVELNPGYPGYRGFVAGLAGSGEVACLEQLQRDFPWFDREHEDQENAAAAVHLGLAGGPKEWVWENWLAIEAERGLPLTCYICAREQFVAGAPFQAAPVDPNDIRLLVGSFGSSELLYRLTARNSLEMLQVDNIAATDYQLRAVAWTAYPGRHINALDLQATFDAIVTAIADDRVVDWPPFGIAVTQGGYAPTPSNAAYKDQLFLVGTAMEAQAQIASEGQGNALRVSFNALVREWTAESVGGVTQGLGEFLCPTFANGFPGYALECPKPSTQ